MKFLNKLYTKVIFSADSTLNVVASDMGESTCTLSIEDEIVKRLSTATGSIGSLAIFNKAQVTIQILKTSPVADIFLKRMLSNGYIGGTLTLYDDTNRAYTLSDVSINKANYSAANGDTPHIEVVLDGNFEVNKEALAGF